MLTVNNKFCSVRDKALFETPKRPDMRGSHPSGKYIVLESQNTQVDRDRGEA